MNLKQNLHRLRQQINQNDFFCIPPDHLNILQKLYNKHNLRLELTCSACPEQYNVYYNNEKIGYYRLRHGEFRVEYKDNVVYTAEPIGDGIFENTERLSFLTKAMHILISKIKENE